MLVANTAYASSINLTAEKSVAREKDVRLKKIFKESIT